jgi:hypothetical protein
MNKPIENDWKSLDDYEEQRQFIITYLSDFYKKEPGIQACWLGWSDANGESDEYSDIDMFLCSDDDKQNYILEQTNNILTDIWSLDYVSNIDYDWNKIWQTFHFKDTPENLLIEIWILKKSNWMIFEDSHPYFKPKIIFDKDTVIKYIPLDSVSLVKSIWESLKTQIDLVGQSSRVKKYIDRENYIESTNYYIRFMFMPLLEVLRIKYTPIVYNWWRIHISRHLPKEIVQRLEKLMEFRSLKDVENNLNSARIWFNETIEDIESKTWKYLD